MYRMTITLIKRHNSRRVNYSWVSVKRVLKDLGWSYEERSGHPLVTAVKTAPDEEGILTVRKDVHRRLELVQHKFPYIIREIVKVD